MLSEEEQVNRIFQKLDMTIDLKALRATVRLLTKIEASRVDGFVPVTETKSVEKALENLKAITATLKRLDWAFGHVRLHMLSESRSSYK